MAETTVASATSLDHSTAWGFPRQSSSFPRISVVMPALNEAENLRHVLPKVPRWTHEIILVDGQSVDQTAQFAREILPEITILTQGGRGKGDALRMGFARASGDIIVMLDSDGSTDPNEIPFFVGALLAGANFAKGSRFAQGGGSDDLTWLRRAGNWALIRTTRLLFGSRSTDLCYGYNAFWRDILPLLELDADGFEIEAQLNVRALRAGLKVVEVPSFEARRLYGRSKLRTLLDGWRVLRTLLRERFRTRGAMVRAATSQRT